MVAYLDAALQEGDAALIAAALGDIARAKAMSQIAHDAGLGLQLYASPAGDKAVARRRATVKGKSPCDETGRPAACVYARCMSLGWRVCHSVGIRSQVVQHERTSAAIWTVAGGKA